MYPKTDKTEEETKNNVAKTTGQIPSIITTRAAPRNMAVNAEITTCFFKNSIIFLINVKFNYLIKSTILLTSDFFKNVRDLYTDTPKINHPIPSKAISMNNSLLMFINSTSYKSISISGVGVK